MTDPDARTYPALPAYGVAPVRPTNTLAILALVFAFVFSPAGIVLGHLARRQIRQTGEQGDGLALAGLIIGYVYTALIALVLVVWLGAIILSLLAVAAAAGQASSL